MSGRSPRSWPSTALFIYLAQYFHKGEKNTMQVVRTFSSFFGIGLKQFVVMLLFLFVLALADARNIP
jgi:hypothetical protein